MCGAGWVLEILMEILCKVYDCLSTKLYTWNQYKIKLKVNCKNKCFNRSAKGFSLQFVQPCNFSVQLSAPSPHTQCSRQVGEGSAKPRAVAPGVTCQPRKPPPPPCPWDHDLYTFLPTMRVRTRIQAYFLFGEPVAVLGRRVIGRTNSHDVNGSKLKLPFSGCTRPNSW